MTTWGAQHLYDHVLSRLASFPVSLEPGYGAPSPGQPEQHYVLIWPGRIEQMERILAALEADDGLSVRDMGIVLVAWEVGTVEDLA